MAINSKTKCGLHALIFLTLTFLVSCSATVQKKHDLLTSDIASRTLQPRRTVGPCVRVADEEKADALGPNTAAFDKIQLGFVLNEGVSCDDANVFWIWLYDLNGQPSRMASALDSLIWKLKRDTVVWNGQDAKLGKTCVMTDSHKEILDISDGTELEGKAGYSVVEVRFASCEKTWSALVEFGAGPKHDETTLTISKWNVPIEVPINEP
jgi:hypothetical protein